MKSFISLVISFNLVFSPFAMAFENTNLVGIDETTERYNDSTNTTGGGTSGSSTTNRSSTSGSTASSGSGKKCAPAEILHIASNTCLATEESKRLKAEADESCSVLTDPQLKASCVNSRVTEQTTRAEDNGEMGKHSDKVSKISLLPLLLAFATLYAAIDHMTTKTVNCPGSKSSYLMIGGAVSLIATEVMTKTTFSKELKKSQKKLEEIVKGSKSSNSDNKNATNLQEEIFQALIDRENGVIKAAEGKKKGYNLAKLMFIGATIAAGIESFKFTSMSAIAVTAPAAATLYLCYDATVKNTVYQEESQLYAYLNFLESSKSKQTFTDYQNKSIGLNLSSVENFQAEAVDRFRYAAGLHSSLSLDDYSQIKINRTKENTKDDVLQQAFTAIRGMVIPEAKAFILGGLEIVMVKGFKKFFFAPYSRLALSGMMTAVTFTLTGHANKEIKKAQKRIEVLEKLKAQVTEAGPAVKCANGTEQGKDGCEQVVPTTVKPGQSTFGLAATQANGSANTNRSSSFEAKGCAKSNGQADPDCGCKKTNSCFSMNSNFKIGETGAGDILGNGINDINALTSGAISPAGLDNDAIGKQLAAAGKMRDKVLADLNKNPAAAAELKKAQDALNGLQRQTFNSMPANASAAANGLALSGDSDFSGLSGNEVLEKVKEELKESSAPKVTNEAVAGSGSEFNFDIGTADPMNVGNGLTEGEGAANTNINDFELAESEINPSSTTNIFEILSSRYKKSAYMRLLKADKEIAPEAPANKEIND